MHIIFLWEITRWLNVQERESPLPDRSWSGSCWAFPFGSTRCIYSLISWFRKGNPIFRNYLSQERKDSYCSSNLPTWKSNNFHQDKTLSSCWVLASWTNSTWAVDTVPPCFISWEHSELPSLPPIQDNGMYYENHFWKVEKKDIIVTVVMIKKKKKIVKLSGLEMLTRNQIENSKYAII